VLYPQGTPCGGGCTGNSLTTQGTCNGSGTCAGTTTSPCPGFLVCSGDGVTCLGVCESEWDCVDPYLCNTSGDPHVCWLKPNGQPCISAGECQSGFCPSQDGVCCNEACDGFCRACADSKNGNSPGGTCANVPGGQDPDGECWGGGNDCNGFGDCDY